MHNNLKAMLADEKTYVVPGVYDCLGAKAAEKVGLELVFVTGNGLSAAALGMPDVGLMTMREVVDCSARIAGCVSIPVIADADTGYGSILNTLRTAREFEQAGIAGIFLEDQITPKRCAYYPGERRLIPAEEHAAKIELAVKRRKNSDFCIIARTDAYRTAGLEETVRRAGLYAQAGADAIFIIGLTDTVAIRAISAEVSIPIIVNINDGDSLSKISIDELNQAGVKLIFYPATVRSAVTKAMTEVLCCLKESGGTADVLGLLATLNEFNQLLDLDTYGAIENEFTVIATGGSHERGGHRNV